MIHSWRKVNGHNREKKKVALLESEGWRLAGWGEGGVREQNSLGAGSSRRYRNRGRGSSLSLAGKRKHPWRWHSLAEVLGSLGKGFAFYVKCNEMPCAGFTLRCLEVWSCVCIKTAGGRWGWKRRWSVCCSSSAFQDPPSLIPLAAREDDKLLCPSELCWFGTQNWIEKD